MLARCLKILKIHYLHKYSLQEYSKKSVPTPLHFIYLLRKKNISYPRTKIKFWWHPFESLYLFNSCSFESVYLGPVLHMSEQVKSSSKVTLQTSWENRKTAATTPTNYYSGKKKNRCYQNIKVNLSVLSQWRTFRLTKYKNTNLVHLANILHY